MKANISVHLDREDKVSRVEVIKDPIATHGERLTTLGEVVRYRVFFESGFSIIIDAEVFNSILIRIPKGGKDETKRLS